METLIKLVHEGTSYTFKTVPGHERYCEDGCYFRDMPCGTGDEGTLGAAVQQAAYKRCFDGPENHIYTLVASGTAEMVTKEQVKLVLQAWHTADQVPDTMVNNVYYSIHKDRYPRYQEYLELKAEFENA